MLKLTSTLLLFATALCAQTVDSNPRKLASVTFANLGTPPNGTIVYCSDCTSASPTGSGGNGAEVRRENGAWNGPGGAAATNTTPAICAGGCGVLYSSNSGSTTNTVYMWLINIPGAMQMAKINFQVSSSTNQAWAIYSTAGSLLATSSTGTGCGGCRYSLALSYTFASPGSYYLAFCASGATNINVAGQTYSAPGVGSITTPMVGTAANSCAWSGSTPNFNSSAGTITTAALGFPDAVLTY